ncbi:hypothetical protein [Ilumatobacter sp.]|uniref:hypothetical protein n=1 Tax=Ilumatobacter sp. TaxID=1967498 RepID=UPI003AF653D5
MSRRNAIWLVAIVAVGVVVGWIAGLVWGLVAGGAVLVVSEVVERVARGRRRAEKHAADASDGVG